MTPEPASNSSLIRNPLPAVPSPPQISEQDKCHHFKLHDGWFVMQELVFGMLCYMDVSIKTSKRSKPHLDQNLGLG